MNRLRIDEGIFDCYHKNMNTITIPIKEYRQSIQLQKNILSRLESLQKIVFENTKDEIDSNVLKRYEAISLEMDKGKGKRFSSISSFKSYVKNL